MSYAQEMEKSTGLTKVFMLEHLVLGFELWVLDWKILAHKKRLTKKAEEYLSEIRKNSAAQLKNKIRMKRTQVMSFECIRILDEN